MQPSHEPLPGSEGTPAADSAAASPQADGESLELELRGRTRRGFAFGAATALAALAGWRWLITRDMEGGIPWPFRRVLAFNERLGRALFKPSRRAAEFRREEAMRPRVNGMIGLHAPLDPTRWRLRVVGRGGEKAARSFSLDEIRTLPRVEMTTELKCIEGWSTVVNWAGARLADLAASTRLASREGSGELFRYAALETPDEGYYVGLDMESALHPQTLLAYEMNGEPLTWDHGAPVRLVIPVKYGIKSLKTVGTIRFTDHRPADYWAERGYDWYAGH